MKNPLRYYNGKWVALDDKDRIVSFLRKDRKEMLKDIQIYRNYLDNFGVRVYKTFDKHQTDIVRSLLN